MNPTLANIGGAFLSVYIGVAVAALFRLREFYPNMKRWHTVFWAVFWPVLVLILLFRPYVGPYFKRRSTK